MRLTIGIPIHNAEKYITRCLDSVLLAKGVEDFEIICVDDGSTDGSLNFLIGYQKEHPQIKVIRQENAGAFLARSKVIDEAKGEWIGFVDADDTIDKDMYEIMLEQAEKNSYVDMVVCAFNKVDSDTGKIQSVQMTSYGNKSVDFKSNPKERGILAGVNPAYWNKIYRRSALEKRLRLEWSPQIMEDYLFSASVFPFMRGVLFVDSPLYYYYNVSTSVTKHIGRKELNTAKKGLHELAVYLRNREDFINDIYKYDLISVMSCVHLGVAFTINWNEYENSHEVIGTIYNETKNFLDMEFPKWKDNVYVKGEYVWKRRQLLKLYVACSLFKSKMWLVTIKLYHILCKIVRNDLKW